MIPGRSTQPQSEQQLRSAARGFLTEGRDCIALAPQHHELLSLLEQFADGRVDASALRAALGNAGQRSPAPKAKTVRVLYLTGLLTPTTSIFTLLGMGTSIQEFMRQLREAAADPSTASIFVVIDTPGGVVNLLPEAAALLREVRQSKPVIGAVLTLNASAGYWISSNMSALEATQSAEIGAIGVYGIRVSTARMLDREGVDVEVFSAGRYKAEGLSVTPITAEERQASLARVNERYNDFVSDVALGRHISTAAVRSGFGEGRIVSAKEALRLGMIDRVATLEESIGRLVAATTAGRLAAQYPIPMNDEDERRARYLDVPLPVPRAYAANVTHNEDDLRDRLRRYY